MNTARRVHCSTEVLTALGPAVVARTREIAAEFTCGRCGRPGDARTAPANLTARRDRAGLVVMQLVHPHCGPSIVTEVDSIGLTRPADAGTQVSSHAVLFPTGTPGEDVACLIIDTTYSLTRTFPSGDIDDYLSGGLLARGWELVGSGDWSLPLLHDVRIDLTVPGGRVVLTNDDAEPDILLDQLPQYLLPQWRAAAQDAGTVMMLAGRAGGAPMTTDKLDAAVRSGALVGCFARISNR